jgi:phosphoribosylaminoimidazole-succinocarboxamide synthase
MDALKNIDLSFPQQLSHYKGKVRDVYEFQNGILVMIVSDRLSAFDVIMPKGIPYKGQMLNQLASMFLDMTRDIVPNWKIATPDPNVTVGHKCEPIKIEMVVRGYLAGHAWRTYRDGQRMLCGVEMPDGMRENDPFPKPIITPATKAAQGDHDEDISKEEILAKGLTSPEIYQQLEAISYRLFERGSRWAAKQGLILVDTKYEFGLNDGKVMLMDEIHTPDSSRYFYQNGYSERQQKGEKQKQLSKEFVRQWLIENGFQGLEDQKLPEFDDQRVLFISNRYIELYERITGSDFEKASYESIEKRIYTNVTDFLKEYLH